MRDANIETVRLQSGCIVDMSVDVYDEQYLGFTASQYFSFNNHINAGLYFPQICQFIAIMVAICSGATSFSEILCWNLSGILFMLAWFWLRLHKFPGLAFLSCLLGGNIFRLFLHFIPITCVAFFLAKDWRVLLFCIVGGVITSVVKTFLFVKLSRVSYNDEIVRYISRYRFKY